MRETDGMFPGFVAKLGYLPSVDSLRRKTMQKIQGFTLTLVLGMACLGTVTLALAQDAKAALSERRFDRADYDRAGPD